MRIRKEFNELADTFRASPCMIADYCGVSPMHIETLLRIRGQMQSGESIKDAIIRNYGESTFKKCEALLGVCPFESERKATARLAARAIDRETGSAKLVHERSV